MSECLLTKARDRGLKGPTVASLIGHALELWPEPAEGVAQELFTEALSPASPEESVQERSRSLRRTLGALLWQRGKDRWEFLWPHFQRDHGLFREVMIEASREHGFRRIEEFSEVQLAELFLALSREFPHAEDTNRYRVAFLGEREMVADCRDSVLRGLYERGTVAAVAQVERLQKEMPQLTHLSWLVLKARRAMLLNAWQPISVKSVLALTRLPASRLVRNERELQGVVLESLQVLQDRFQGETPSVRDVWDKCEEHENVKWRPVNENEFSDYVKRHLEHDLKGRGIVALREVQVRPGHASTGERTDIYVTASIQENAGGAVETVWVIVEVKGCWHADLKTAMGTQLRDRYLKDNKCHAGIYVVAWFACGDWDMNDRRHAKTPKWSVDYAKSFFSQQAEGLSADKILRAFVFDVSLR